MAESAENYISQKAIDKILGNSVRALTPYEVFNERIENQKWGKEKNWLMFLEMDKEEFLESELNNFISNTLIPLTE